MIDWLIILCFIGLLTSLKYCLVSFYVVLMVLLLLVVKKILFRLFGVRLVSWFVSSIVGGWVYD